MDILDDYKNKFYGTMLCFVHCVHNLIPLYSLTSGFVEINTIVT